MTMTDQLTKLRKDVREAARTLSATEARFLVEFVLHHAGGSEARPQSGPRTG